jgi:uncharacterized protein YjiS (DUF1127 family)
MRQMLSRVAQACRAAGLAAWIWLQQKEKVAVKLAELDERTLRDIGLEAWRSPLGAEIALRRHESRRVRAAVLGLW